MKSGRPKPKPAFALAKSLILIGWNLTFEGIPSNLSVSSER